MKSPIFESSVRLEPTTNGLDAAIDRIVKLKAAQAYKDVNEHMREKTFERWRLASRRTPYAESSIGSTQEFTGLVRGFGAFFGLDSGAALQAAIDGLKVGRDGIFFYTRLFYFWYLMGLFAQKGPFSPEHILFFSPLDVIAFDAIADKVVERAADGKS